MAAYIPAGPTVNLSESSSQTTVEPKRGDGQFSIVRLALLQEAIRSSQQTRGEDIVALVGMTGSGVSSIVNSLLGCQFVGRRVDGRYRLDVDAGPPEIAKIGHSRLHSETLFPQVYRQEGLPYTLVDLGGFMDTRGAEYEVAKALATKMILENAKSVKLVFCFDSNGLNHFSGSSFFQFINNFAAKLLRNGLEENQRSIAILLTKPSKSDTGWHHTDDLDTDVKECLKGLKNTISQDDPIKALLNALLNEEGPYLMAYNLRDPGALGRFNILLNKMEAMNEPIGKFKLTYSAESVNTILQRCTVVVLGGKNLLSEYHAKRQEKIRFELELTDLNQQIDRLRNSAQREVLEDGHSLEDMESLIGENQQFVERGLTKLATFDALISEKASDIASIEEAIELWKVEAEKEVEYWSEDVNQRGIQPNIRDEVVEVHETISSYPYTRKVTRTIPIRDRGRSIGHDFVYRGPKFLRVERDGLTGTWSDEMASEDKTSYRIHYESGIGMDAIARIRVIVKKGEDPQEQLKLHELNMRKAQFMQEKSSIEHEKNLHNNGIDAARSRIRNLEYQIERQKHLNTDLEVVEGQKGGLIEKIGKLSQEISHLNDEITRLRPDFELLTDYLRLSQDEYVAQDPLIVEFFKEYESYQQSMAGEAN
jgi:hypothetical protein